MFGEILNIDNKHFRILVISIKMAFFQHTIGFIMYASAILDLLLEDTHNNFFMSPVIITPSEIRSCYN